MNKVPSVAGDVAVSRERTANIARCAHCGELVQLAQDLDNEQTRLAHRGPCEAWQRGGVAYIARAAGADPERAVELMVDHRRLLFTRGDADVMLAALDHYRDHLRREIDDGKREPFPLEMPQYEQRAAQLRGLAVMLEAAVTGAEERR